MKKFASILPMVKVLRLSTMADFDPQRARGKRPMPIWMDAFVRDTLQMDGDEVGAYFLMLGTMWTSKDCSLPNDPRKLARVCRCSLAKFKNRIGPAIMPLLVVQDDIVFSMRLRKEAIFVQMAVTKQYCRRTGENSAKLLKNKDWGLSVVKAVEKPREPPTQQPNNLHKSSPSDSRETEIPSLFGPDQKKASRPSRFDEFWAAYPHRGGIERGKAAALKKYQAAVKRGVPEDQIIDGAIASGRDKMALDGYAPDPAKWLHGERWADDYDSKTSAGQMPQGADAQAKRRSILEHTASKMVKSGSHWLIGSLIVSDRDIHDIEKMGLLPVDR